MWCPIGLNDSSSLGKQHMEDVRCPPAPARNPMRRALSAFTLRASAIGPLVALVYEGHCRGIDPPTRMISMRFKERTTFYSKRFAAALCSRFDADQCSLLGSELDRAAY